MVIFVHINEKLKKEITNDERKIEMYPKYCKTNGNSSVMNSSNVIFDT